MTLLERFWSKVDQHGEYDCWPWLAARDRKGYGWFRIASAMRGSHRMAWELTHGSIPHGLCVLHHCDNPGCVNPAHLFLGTRADNNADRDAKGRQGAPKGDRNGSRTCPEHRPRGERHGSRIHPECVSSDDAHAIAHILSRCADAGDGCLLWTGARNGGTRYAVVCVRGKLWVAHRFLWVQQHGAIDRKVQLEPTCGHRHCLNLAHWRIKTKTVKPPPKSLGTHCKRGHRFAPETTWFQKQPNGGISRRCAICAKAYQRKYYRDHARPEETP